MTVTPACAADIETEVLVAFGTPKCGFPPLVGHVSVCGGLVFLKILIVLGATYTALIRLPSINKSIIIIIIITNHAKVVTCGSWGMFGGVVPTQTKGGWTAGPGLRGGGLLCRSCR